MAAFRWPLLVSGVLMFAFLTGASTAAPKGEKVDHRIYDDSGRLVWELGHSARDSDLAFARHFTHSGGPSGASSAALTDCKSTLYKLGGWKWSAPYAAKASSFAGQMNLAGQTWDGATGASIFGGITAGSDGTAGVQDFKNQIDWVSLGATTTIAVTTTWYYRSTGQAVESDGQYNTYYAWDTSGSASAMDVQNIGTHEVGHSFGLDHPKGSPPKISCLTMYAYGSEGELQKRTLGDGDILGIRALYGA